MEIVRRGNPSDLEEVVRLEQERIALLDKIIYVAKNCEPGVARLEIQLTIGMINEIQEQMAGLESEVETWERIYP
jgi:hypothetical protein